MKYSVTIHLEHDKAIQTQMDGVGITHTLEQVFEWGNIYQPQNCRSLSVGDVVELSIHDPLATLVRFNAWGGCSRFFLCCSVGWREMTREEFKDFIARDFPSRLMDARSRERGFTWEDQPSPA